MAENREIIIRGIVPQAKLAFFDLDETITDTDTDGLWARWRLFKSIGGMKEVIAIFSLMRSYQRGTMSIDRYMKYHKMRVSSLTPEKYDAMAHRFFDQWGRDHIFPEAEEILNYYQAHSVPTVLLTAQNDVIARRFSEYLKMDGIAGNAFNVEEGKFTSPITPYCYREGKIDHALKFAAAFGVAMDECAFYSDSINDLSLLSEAGYPVVTNPDALLAREAARRNWPVIIMKKKGTG